MKVSFEQEALEEYRDAARYSETLFGQGVEFVSAVGESLAIIPHSVPTREK